MTASGEHEIPTTKAGLLVWLYGKLQTARIPLSVLITRAQWVSRPAAVLTEVREQLGREASFIVRSSAPTEDQASGTQAGRYLSVANVSTDGQIQKAIDAVFASYDITSDCDVLFVQRMIEQPSTVGVAFTSEPATGSPYLVVNFAEHTSTDAITSGSTNHSTWMAAPDGLELPPTEDLRLIPPLVNELKGLLKWKAIDIEFAVAHGVLYLLQARPLRTPDPSLTQSELTRFIKRAQHAFDRWTHPHPWLAGSSTVLGVMPDWNPAEIIGIRPRPLALSLYRFLVTDDLWSTQRAAYGYRKVPGVPLLVELSGLPFIDVRASLNSLIPATLEDGIAGRLVDSCIRLLANDPSLHDKVEFRVLPTCLAYDTAEELANRFSPPMSSADRQSIIGSLRDLTAAILERHSEIAAGENRLIQQMGERRITLINRTSGLPDRIYWLLMDCAEFGTRPFVGQARRAFVATEILKSLIRGGLVEQSFLDSFMKSLRTIARQFQLDQQNQSIDYLLDRYGHLRPGTYDIRAPRYDETPDLFLRPISKRVTIQEEEFAPTAKQASAIQRFLDMNQIAISHSEFLAFARESIESRESSKFAFTRNLSDALKCLAEFGGAHNLSRDDLSFLRITDVLLSYASAADVYEIIVESIQRGRRGYAATSEIFMPSLITSRGQMLSFVQSDDQPNFVGDRVVVGPVKKGSERGHFSGAILFIESADPGFDWIFGHDLAAFVTMYGGANSHMSIRAYELGVPAVIGAGPNLYSQWIRARILRVDPANRKVEVVQ